MISAASVIGVMRFRLLPAHVALMPHSAFIAVFAFLLIHIFLFKNTLLNLDLALIIAYLDI